MYAHVGQEKKNEQLETNNKEAKRAPYAHGHMDVNVRVCKYAYACGRQQLSTCAACLWEQNNEERNTMSDKQRHTTQNETPRQTNTIKDEERDWTTNTDPKTNGIPRTTNEALECNQRRIRHRMRSNHTQMLPL